MSIPVGQSMQLRGFLIALTMSAACAGVVAASEPSWWSRLWGRNKQAPAAKKAEPPKADSQQATVIPSREKEIWLRRAEICQKLREIALTSNDEALLRKADQLDQRAFDTYMQKIAGVRSVADGTAAQATETKAKAVRRKGKAEDEQ